VASSNPAVRLTAHRTVPLALNVTVPMAVEGSPVSDRLTIEFGVIHSDDDGTDEELRIEIVNAVWVLTDRVTEFDDCDPE